MGALAQVGVGAGHGFNPITHVDSRVVLGVVTMGALAVGVS